MAPLVSIVITTYNRERYLAAAIESVLSQTYSNWELLVWDDGSTDRSVEIAHAIAQCDSRIRVVAAPHRGRVKSLRAAIAQTSGTYLGWVDSDDALHPRALQETVPVLQRHPDAGFVYTNYLDMDEQGHVLGLGHRCRIPYSRDRLLVDFMTFHFRLIRRSTFEQVGGIDGSPDFVEDYDVCLRLSEAASVEQITQPLYFYRIHSAAASQQYRLEQILRTRTVIEQALQRRALAARYALDVQVPEGRFILRQRSWARSPAVLAPLLAVPLAGVVSATYAQSITPAANGTNTIVTPSGDRLDISGGQLSGDRANLFHSFEQFGLNTNQIANFLATPQLQNIFGRVVGGNPSVINGLIQVTGGSANLYLMNPAGIVFGPNASLNVPGSFSATTATGIRFGSGEWGVGNGADSFAALVGNPSAFVFGSEPGAIVNAGTLAVTTGQSLTLIGGTVVNTGQILAPEGSITIASVPGTSLVRLSQPGNPLSLEFQPQLATGPDAPTLPQLLTGGTIASATGLTVNPDGSVRLTGSGTAIPSSPGTTIVAGTLNASGQTGGSVTVTGTQVGLVGATIEASGVANGGTVRIGGDFGGSGTIPNATRTVVDPTSVIRVDSQTAGNGGRVSVWANDSTRFLGTITARGGAQAGNGGFVEVSGKQTLSVQGSVDTTAPNGAIGTLLLDPTDITISNAVGDSPGVGAALPDIFQTDFPGSAITISQTTLQGLAAGATIVLEATNNITIGPLTGNTLTFASAFGATALGSITLTADADGNGVGSVSMNPGDTIQAAGRNLTISGASLAIGNISTSGAPSFRPGGNITLTATNGNLTAGNLNSSVAFVPGAANGEIRVTSNTGTITVDRIEGRGYGPANPVTLTTLSNGGDITFTSIDTRSNALFGAGSGGNVTISARGQVRGIGTLSDEGTIATTGEGGSDGTVTIQHDGGPANLPFVVGGSVTATSGNGTQSTISAGANTIPNGTYAFAPSPVAIGGSQITFSNTAPSLSASAALSTQQDQAIALSFADLGIAISDANADLTSVQVAAIAPGVTLRVNGAIAVPGTLIPANATLEVVPPAGFSGDLSSAFSLRASDGIAVSAPSPIALQVKAPTPETPSELPTLPDPPCTLTRCETTSGPGFPTDIPSGEIDLTPIPEDSFTRQFETYLGLDANPIRSLDEIKVVLNDIERDTGAKPAIVYVGFIPPDIDPSGLTRLPNSLNLTGQGAEDQLELVVVTAKGNPVRQRLANATRAEVLTIAQRFRQEVTDQRKVRSTSYLKPAQQLYQWLVAPVQPSLQERGITNLLFIVDEGLRSLPLAALHTGNGFLIEQYSVGLTPSLSLTDTRYRDIRDAKILGLGISESTQGQTPLPAVFVEVSTLVNRLWSGRFVLNTDATLSNLIALRQQQPFGIIHLATHADFQPGAIENSYIQLWNDKLRLSQLRELGWNNPQIQLLALSACTTALGNREAELGFAGLAVQAGVKSAVASLWYVSDAATTALMTKFYTDLRNARIKAEALRQAQLALATGAVFLKDDRLQGLGLGEGVPLPASSLSGNQQFTHPFYWAAFTLIGNPW